MKRIDDILKDNGITPQFMLDNPPPSGLSADERNYLQGLIAPKETMTAVAVEVEPETIVETAPVAETTAPPIEPPVTPAIATGEPEPADDDTIAATALELVKASKSFKETVQGLLDVYDITIEEAQEFAGQAFENKLDDEKSHADKMSKEAADARDKELAAQADADRQLVEKIALKQNKKIPATPEEIARAATIVRMKTEQAERELLPDFESLKSEYPVFPDFVMYGTTFYENHVKPICDANPGARVPHFNFIPGVVMLLNYVGTKVSVKLRGWKPSLYVVIIGKKGKVKKSSSMNDAIGYFTQIGVGGHYGKEIKNAEGRSLVWEAGSAEGLGTDMQRINCKNAVLFYDELSVLAKKANIESSTVRDMLLKGYESGMFGNSIKSKKDSFTVAPNSYVLSLLAGCTKKKFAETYMLLGSGHDGLDDRFSFHLQPEVLERSRPQVWVDTGKNSAATKLMIEKAMNQASYDIEPDALKLLTDAMAAGLDDRDEIRAEKYALYFAIDLGLSTINVDCVQRGLAVTRYEVAVKKYLKLVEADSKQAQLQIKIRRLLEEAGKAGMSERDLERKANSSRQGTYNWFNAMTGLLKSGIIREITVMHPKSGRESKGYQVLKLIEQDDDDE